MSCLGTGEVITLAMVILIVFSASRMGQLGNALGRFVHSFKKASKGDDLIDVTPSKRRGVEPEDAQLVEGERVDPSRRNS